MTAQAFYRQTLIFTINGTKTVFCKPLVLSFRTLVVAWTSIFGRREAAISPSHHGSIICEARLVKSSTSTYPLLCSRRSRTTTTPRRPAQPCLTSRQLSLSRWVAHVQAIPRPSCLPYCFSKVWFGPHELDVGVCFITHLKQCGDLQTRMDSRPCLREMSIPRMPRSTLSLEPGRSHGWWALELPCVQLHGQMYLELPYRLSQWHKSETPRS